MARARPTRRHLTKTIVEAAKPGKGDRIIWDADQGKSKGTTGFGLRIRSSGHKTFILQYRVEGRVKKYKIGNFGDWTVQQARKEAGKLRRLVDEGQDPMEWKQVRTTEGPESVGALCDLFLERHAKHLKQEVSWKEDQRRINKRIKPRLGHLRADKLTESEVDGLFHDIGRDHPVEANRVLVLLASIYSWAIRKGHLPSDTPNPASRSKQDLYPEKERARVLKSDERPRLLEAIDLEPDPFHRAIFRLLLLTGLRKSELLNARHSDLDLKKRTLHLPKTKSGMPRTVPLSKVAVEIIRDLPRCEGNGHLFPAHRIDQKTSKVQSRHNDRPMNNPNKQWARIRRRACCPDLRIHDLRRTASVTVIEATGNPKTAQKILGHADLQTTMKHYSSVEEAEVREGVEALAKALLAD